MTKLKKKDVALPDVSPDDKLETTSADDGKTTKKKKKKNKRARTENDVENPEDHATPEKKKLKGILKPSTASDASSSIEGKEDGGGKEEVEPLLVNPFFQPKPSSAASSSSSLSSKKDKMRKKLEMRRAAKATAQEAKKNDAGEEIRCVEAKEYLRSWKHDKSNWKFNKSRQTWLLKNLFVDDNALDDEAFGILLEYLRPLKGKAREETIKQAEAKVNESGVEFLQAERARLVAQMLA